jgi:transposase
VATDAKLKALTKELAVAAQARGPHLLDLRGIGPAGAARILADVSDVARFPDRNHFASWTGTAPLDASSGEHIRHRHYRAGNRRLNHVLHMAAIAQIRLPSEGRTYYLRKLGEAKTRKEATTLPETTTLRHGLPPARRRRRARQTRRRRGAGRQRRGGPGRALGGVYDIQRGRPAHPVIGSSDQPRPGPAATTLPATRTRANPHTVPAPQPPRRRARAVKVERPTGRTTLTATSAAARSKAPKPRP